MTQPPPTEEPPLPDLGSLYIAPVRYATAEPAATAPALGPLALLGAGAVAVVGSFLPWVSVTVLFATLEVSGVDGDRYGIYTAVLGCGLIAYAAFVRRGWRPAIYTYLLAILGALTTVGIATWAYVDTFRRVDELGLPGSEAQVSSGPGIWLVLAAGLVGAVSAAATWPSVRR